MDQDQLDRLQAEDATSPSTRRRVVWAYLLATMEALEGPEVLGCASWVEVYRRSVSLVEEGEDAPQALRDSWEAHLDTTRPGE